MTKQMREAARDNDLIRRGDVTAIPLLGMTVTQIERAIRAIPIAPQPEGASQIVEYTNWRGETARRVIRPVNLWWGKTDWHPEEQWMLTAYDCEKDAMRDFAWQDMRPVPNPATSIPIAPQPSENRLFNPDSHWGDFIRSAVAEAEKAMRKYPQPNYVITKVAEEAGEVVKAAVHAAEGRETLDNVRGEMLQLVAMLFRLWMEGDQVHGLPPVSGVMAASALTIHPADPLSDPRVVALVEACKTADTIARDLGWHRIYDATDAAIRAIGGEA